MKKRKRTPLEEEVDREIIAKGKEVLKDFDESEAIHIPAKKLESKLISIRIPMNMLDKLREVAVQKGHIGYQQLIKTYVAEGLLREEWKILAQALEPSIHVQSNISLSSSSICQPLQPEEWVTGVTKLNKERIDGN